MPNLFGPINSGAAVGGNGVATANKDSDVKVSGKVLAVYIKYNDSPPAGTTDVVIATKGTHAPALPILTISNAATDGWFFPRAAAVSQAGAALVYSTGNPVEAVMPISDIVNVAIAQANAADNVDVWLMLE
jgi:hypothetical protein